MYNVKVRFDGDIIITDPCYITKKRDESSAPKWANYFGTTDYRGKNRNELEALEFFEKHARYEAAYEQWSKENPDDWTTCNCGSDMSALGLKTYLTDSTLYGDWSCTTLNTDTKEAIGQFCADSGQVGVFLLEEVLKYNPDFDNHINRPHTTTLIKDFHGEIELHTNDDNTEVTVVGRGNRNFVGMQTGF